jgi:putative ABC transport system permease protein
LREAVATSVANLGGHKLRSGLTTLGIVFGVGAVIAMLSIGAGAERQALATIARLGLHNVVVRAKQLKEDEAKELRTKSVGVSLRDAEAIRDAVPGVQLVAPKVEIRARKVFALQRSTEAKVFGVAASHARLVDLHVAEGRFLDPLDETRHEQVAVIGSGVRRALFGFGPAVGREIKVADVWLEVVGVLAPVVEDETSIQGVDLGSASTAVFIPASTALRKFDRDPLASPLDELIVRLDEGASGREAGAAVHALLDHLHAGADDFELVVPETLLAESQRTQRMFDLVMGCIAGISLLVGGIGIMNIMLATVLERTREIGLRRAVGARRRDIVLQFLVEAFTLSALGGLAGILMGTLISRLVAASAGWPTVVTWGSVALAAGVAMAVGLTSGLYPAKRAADLDPIEALRYE